MQYCSKKNKKVHKLSFLVFILLGFFFSIPLTSAQSSINQISLSASLYNNDNTLINGEFDIRFSIYSTDRITADPFPSTSDTSLWNETQTVTVKNGVFKVFLGSVTPFPASLNFSSGDYFLGIRVATDAEMVPRKKLGAVPNALNSQFLQGRTLGTGAGNIPFLNTKGDIDIKNLPTGTGDKQLVIGSDDRLADIHQQNTDTGTDSETFNIGSGTALANTNFDLTVSSATATPTLRYNGTTGAWQFSNDGTTFTGISGGVDPDTLDFTEFVDSMTLDASTDISITGSNVFSLTNTGTGYSFLVNDVASDTTPFVIAADGSVGIGTTSPSAKLDISNASVATGSELITNGSFTGSAAGWTLGNNVAYGTNNVTSTYAGGNPSFSTTFATVAGQTYLLTFTVSGANRPTYYYLTNNTLTYDSSPVTNGTATFVFQSNYTGTETIVFDDWFYQSGDTWTIDDVSIKQTTLPSPALTVEGSNGQTWLSLGDDTQGNTGLGISSLQSNTTGYYNTAYGAYSLSTNTTGASNAAFGISALQFNTTGQGNVALGNWAMLSNTTGNNSTATGNLSLYKNTTGFRNTAYGAYSLLNNTTGTYNLALGYQAGMNETTGSGNIFIGTATSSASYGQVTTGSNNIAIGYNVAVASPTASNQLNIGNLIYGTGLDGTGATLSSGNIGIGTKTPGAKLTIDASGANTMPLSIKTNGSAGNYTATNSGIFMYDAAGTETLRIVASDPNGNNYNSGNLYIGGLAGADNPVDNVSAGFYNTGVGYGALTNNTTGYENEAFGTYTLTNNTIGVNNVALGAYNLFSNVDGDNNIGVGVYNLYSTTASDGNVAVGAYSLYSADGGGYNTTLGDSAGYGVTTGANNILIGAAEISASYNQVTTGSNNIAIGYSVAVASPTASNQINIGNLIYGTGLDGTGATLSTGNIGIGDKTPDGKFDVDVTGAVTAASYGINLSNLTTNATTDAINKYGAYITSTGSWTGDAGTATNNYGLYVDTVSGADNNYGAYFAQNVGIGTTSPAYKLQVSASTEFAALDPDSTGGRLILSKGSSATIAVQKGGASSDVLIFGGGNLNDMYMGINATATSGLLHFRTTGLGINYDGLSVPEYLSVNGNILVGLDTNAGDATGGTIRGGTTINGNPSLGGALTVQSGSSSGSNKFGADFTLIGGASTGNATGGSILFKTTPAGGSGSSVNTAATAMTILGSGNVGIGDTTPSYKLEVATDIASDYVSNFFNDGNTDIRYGIQIQAGADDGSGTTYYLNALDGDGGQVGYIANTAGTFALTDPSDIRTKTNIEDTRFTATPLLNDLRIVDFNRKSDPDGPRITGFIAQEVQSIYPNAVTESSSGILGIMKDAFIPLLVKGFQEQNDRITIVEEGLSQITLQTTENISTLAQLQVSVDDQLIVVGDTLNTINTTIQENRDSTEAHFLENDTHLSDVDTLIESLGEDLNTQTARTTLLESRMDTLTDQVSTLIEFYTTFDLSSLVMVDGEGDVEIAGKLKATILQTGGITIEVVDEEASTIGRGEIKSGETEVTIETKAVKADSHIIVTPRALTSLPLAVTDVTDEENFTVKIADPAITDISFDWWIIEKTPSP